MQWLIEILKLMRKHSDDYLVKHAIALKNRKDDSYLRILNHMRARQVFQATFSDFGDVNHGSVKLPMYPR